MEYIFKDILEIKFGLVLSPRQAVPSRTRRGTRPYRNGTCPTTFRRAFGRVRRGNGANFVVEGSAPPTHLIFADSTPQQADGAFSAVTIKKQIERTDGAILLLDFDGVLSDIAPTPDEAVISETAKLALSVCAKKFPVVVISGRSLEDVKKKAGLENVSYSGNHGLEWQALGEKPFSTTPRPESLLAVTAFKEKLSMIFARFPGTFLEDKILSIAIHYRKLDPLKVPSFVRETLKAAKLCAKSGNFLIEHNKKTVELRPNDTWDKGKISLFFLEKLGNGKLPIYIGDSLTDENAFLALENIGLTIRVGKKNNSAAKYYFKNRAEVDKFLQWLALL